MHWPGIQALHNVDWPLSVSHFLLVPHLGLTTLSYCLNFLHQVLPDLQALSLLFCPPPGQFMFIKANLLYLLQEAFPDNPRPFPLLGPESVIYCHSETAKHQSWNLIGYCYIFTHFSGISYGLARLALLILGDSKKKPGYGVGPRLLADQCRLTLTRVTRETWALLRYSLIL